MNIIKKQVFWPYVLAFGAAALLLGLKVPFLYTVNDDLFMKSILSGAYLGVPDAHVVYMEYPLSLLLSGLYRITAAVDWYGIVFFLFHILSWGAVCSRCMQLRAGRRRATELVFFFFLFLAAGFYQIASMQFTVTAAVLGAAGLVRFLTADTSLSVRAYLKDQSVTALFVFLSFNVRRNVLLMLVPMAGMLWLGRLLLHENRQDIRKRLVGMAGMAGLCAAGVLLSIVCYLSAYGSAEWKNYIRFNDHATVLYDYSGWPDYGENRELYEELGVTYESFHAARTAYLLSVDNGIDAAAMERLAERSEQLRGEQEGGAHALTEALKVCLRKIASQEDRPLNLITVGLYAAVLAGLLAGRKRRELLLLLFFFLGRMFSWLYVVLAGRYPVRITQSLYLAECAVLLVFLFGCAAEGYALLWKKNRFCKLAAAAGAVCLIGATGYLGMARVRHVYAENTARLETSRDLMELKSYCSSRPDRFYFVDTRSVTEDTERVFDRTQAAYENYIVFGGWLSESPVYLQKIREAGAAPVEPALLESGRVYVIAENEERSSLDYLTAYFESRYEDFRMEAVEQFGRDGGQFRVYRLAAGSKKAGVRETVDTKGGRAG